MEKWRLKDPSDFIWLQRLGIGSQSSVGVADDQDALYDVSIRLVAKGDAWLVCQLLIVQQADGGLDHRKVGWYAQVMLEGVIQLTAEPPEPQ